VIRVLLWALLVFFPGALGFANPALHEEDLSGGHIFRLQSFSDVLKEDRLETEALPGVLEFHLLREDRGILTPVSAVEFRASSGSFSGAFTTDRDGVISIPAACAASDKLSLEASFKNAHFSIENPSGSRAYRLLYQGPCEGRVRWIVKSDSEAGQILGVWQVAERARRRLEAEVGLAFWKKRIPFVFPSDGDYYSWGKVNITRGDFWDVVGHELGHAIYDQAGIGGSQGGQHKIDQCYTGTLAFSEGWASFFSAWVSVPLDDADARFEFMVPRRAPLRFESIPADVCAGQTNEWRVTGFLWDLMDLHADPEVSEAPFGALWQALTGSRVPDSKAAARRLVSSRVMSPGELESIWQQNFLTTLE